MNSIIYDGCDIITSIEMRSNKKRKKGIKRKHYNVAGIYKIVNRINGKYYVGSSRLLIFRMYDHKTQLNNNIHSNSHLQAAWNKYGENAFTFNIIKIINTDDCIKILDEEQIYLDIAKLESHNVYNKVFTSFGVHKKSMVYKEKMIKNLILKNDANTYTFINTTNGDACIGTRYDLRQQFQLSSSAIRNLVNKKKYKNWIRY